MDYYRVLGVERSASESEVKKAYRKLASKHHPDKGGDPEEFRKVQEAYEQITNPTPEPEQMYSRGRRRYTNNDIFEDMFGNRGQSDERFEFFRQQAERNPDAVADIQISLLSAYTGTDYLLDVGFTKEMLQIQPGVRAGTKLRMPGKGHQRFRNSPPGDLIARVNILMPPGMARENDDLFQELTINSIDAIIGCNTELDHVSGKKLSIKVPANTQQGAKLRLTGWGMPNPSTGKKGNLYALIKIVTPTITKQEHIDMLTKINQEVQ